MPLADRVGVMALVAAEHPALAIDDLAGAPEGGAAVAAQKRPPADSRQEAEVLALAPVGDRQPRVARQSPDRGLRHPPSGNEGGRAAQGRGASM